MIQSRFIQN